MEIVQSEKQRLHAACDECRARKLKCSGDAPVCSRCEREKLRCVYSPQKPMGRPKKRRREDTRPEEKSEGQLEPSPPLPSFPTQAFGDGGLASPTDLNVDFPVFGDVVSDDVYSNATIPPPYVGTLGPAFAPHPSFSADPIDPLLWDQQMNDSGFNSQADSTPGQPDTGPCSCLSLMYLALTDLQSLSNFAFPAVIPRIRSALAAASTMVHCPQCPMEVFTAIQNVQSLSALLSAIAERFHKVLAAIDAEANRLEQTGEKKSFRMGDNSPENAHLHTGTPDCPMGYDIKLDPQDWKKLAKRMLKTEVMGGGQNPTTLISLIEELEKRQLKWHNDPLYHSEERKRIYGAENLCRGNNGDAMCLKMIGHVRKMVERMSWE